MRWLRLAYSFMVAYPDLLMMLLRRWLQEHCSMIQTQNATTTVIIMERITIAGITAMDMNADTIMVLVLLADIIMVMMDVAVITGSKLGEFRT